MDCRPSGLPGRGGPRRSPLDFAMRSKSPAGRRLAQIGRTATEGEGTMPKKLLTVGLAVGLAIGAGVVSSTRAFQASGESIAIDSDDLAGTVSGPTGPEAGV